MRGIQLTGFGGLEVLHASAELPEPTPGPGELVVAVAASSVNNTDVWTREGAYGTASDPDARAGWRGAALEFPRVQGGDIVGRVVGVGAGVPEARLGERVLVDCALYAAADVAGARDAAADADAGADGARGREAVASPDALPVALLGSERDGGFAELVAVPAGHAHDVGGSPLTDDELACLPIAYGTALGMLRRGGLAAGDLVAVTGASGGVGLAAVQLAAALGARVVAVTSPGKVDRVRAAGADEVVCREPGGAPASVVAQLDDALGRRRLDLVVDVVAGQALAGLLALLRPGGRLVVAGAMAGAAVGLDVRRLYLDNLSLVGSTMHSPRIFAELVELARRGTIRPVIAATYPLEQLAQAQQELVARRHVGKLVVTVAPSSPSSSPA